MTNEKTKEIQTTVKSLAKRGGVSFFLNRDAAFRWAYSGEKAMRVMMVDHPYYCVCFPADASRLKKAGYEYAK